MVTAQSVPLLLSCDDDVGLLLPESVSKDGFLKSGGRHTYFSDIHIYLDHLMKMYSDLKESKKCLFIRGGYIR